MKLLYSKQKDIFPSREMENEEETTCYIKGLPLGFGIEYSRLKWQFSNDKSVVLEIVMKEKEGREEKKEQD